MFSDKDKTKFERKNIKNFKKLKENIKENIKDKRKYI
jgi:hypothetical protein